MPRACGDKISEMNEIVREGFLDVKYPPSCPDRKRWKAWHRQWVRVVILEKNEMHGNLVSLQILGFPLKQQHVQACTVLWSAKINRFTKLFHSHSRSRPQKTFGVGQTENSENKGQGPTVLVYLGAQDERHAQIWMDVLRNAILPPSPLVQIEGVWQTRHTVSLIDDVGSFQLGLLGIYGHLMTDDDSLSIIHPHFENVIVQWPLSNVREVKITRVDYDNSLSGVLAIIFKKRKEYAQNHANLLCFYSPTAKTAVEELNETLRKVTLTKSKLPSRSPSKYKKDLDDIHDLFLQTENTKCVTVSCENNVSRSTELSTQTLDEEPKTSPELSQFSNMLSKTPNNFLNCSISSTFQTSNNFDSSSDESDYSPPMSLLKSDFCYETEFANNVGFYTRENSTVLVSEYENLRDTCTNKQKEFKEEGIFPREINDIRRASKFSMDSHIYADVVSFRVCRQPSSDAGTLYEELMDSPTEPETCGDEEVQYVPPLPPPRSYARRPTTLQLEQLSESVENVLANLKRRDSMLSTRSATEKKSTSIWTNPIKSVKKILSKEKSKSNQPSPTKELESSKENSSVVKRVVSEPTFRNDKSPSVPDRSSSFYTDNNQHLISESDLPVPFLPNNANGTLITGSSEDLKQERRHRNWSSEKLDFNDLKHKHSCLRHFLQSLEKNGDTETNSPCHCSCPSSNQNNSPVASPATISKFTRRQSKSLTADIEKHFRDLYHQTSHSVSKKKIHVPIPRPAANFGENSDQDSPHQYCYMGPNIFSFSQKVTHINSENTKSDIQVNGFKSEDDFQYVDMNNTGLDEIY